MAEHAFDLSSFPVHLGLGATVVHLPEFDGSPDWYERYGAAHESDGAEGRLVSLHTFDAPWDSWEMHPNGQELVACVSGRITLHQEIDGDDCTVVLETGQAVVNPLGVWHTADVDVPATVLFITAGLGTQIRPSRMIDAAPEDPRVAWREFCALLEEAGAVLARDDLGLTDLDRAEGLRYLGRLLQNGLASFLENPGPRHPRFSSLPAHCGFGLDNPDNVYSSAGIDPQLEYRISGNRGTIAYLSFAAQNQNYAARDRITGGAGHLNDDELVLDADGGFEIVASQREHAGNWLQLAPDSSMILVRQTFADRDSERAADVVIECIGVDEPAPGVVPRAVPRQLLGAAMYAIGASSWFADWVTPWRDEPNQLHFPDPEHHRLVGGDPNIVFQLGAWELGPDDALVIDVTPPVCAYWNFQVGNIWAECLDKRRRISVNHVTAVYETDGSVRIVIAHRDPGHPNWIDTTGHDHGIMGLRWVRAETHPAATTGVVSLADARSG